MRDLDPGRVDSGRSSVPPGAPGALVTAAPHAIAAAAERTGWAASGGELGLLSLLKRKLRVVLGVAATTFLLVMLATLLSTMEFAASSRLYLGELDGKARSSVGSAEDIDLALGGQSDLASEIEILRSRSLLSLAVRESGLNVEVSRLGAAKVRYWRWRLSGRDPNLLDAADKELRGVRAQLTDRAQKERRFEVAFTGPGEFELWAPEVRTFATRQPAQRLAQGRLDQPLSIPGLELTLRGGRERQPEVGSRYQLLVYPVEEAVDAVLKTLEVSAPKSSGRADPVKVVTLTFRHVSPTLAVEFLEGLMRCYLQERQAWKTADASAVEAFVTEQLSVTRSLLDEIQRKLADYRTKNRAVVLDNEAKAMIAQISKYEEQRVAARLELAALVDVDRSLSQPKLPIEAYMLGEAKDSVLEDLAASLSKARRELTDLEARYNASAPSVREQRAQVNAQLDTIRGYVRARMRRAEDNLKTLDGIIAQYEDELRSVPEAELGLAQLTRESQVYGALYSNLLMRQQQTAIVKASTVSRNRVLDPARVGYREESPRLPLRLASALVGLALGAGLVVLGRLVSSSFASEAEVQGALSPLPVLANVPKRRQRWAKGRRKPGDVPFDLLSGDVNFEFVEAFRALRTRLYQTALSPEQGEVLLITSPSRGDGKTTVALSLASILAADGKGVLLIDVDLRQGRAPVDSAPRTADLRAALIGQCGFDEAVQRMTVAGGDYDFLGPDGAAPVELIASARMLEFLEEARARWDFVLIDVPSFPLVSDALALAPAADAVLSVIRLEATPARLALDHVQRLSAVARGHALIVNDPGSRRRQGEAYPAAPQRAFSKALGRWTWRDWGAMDPPAARPRWSGRLGLATAGLVGASAVALAWVMRQGALGESVEPALAQQRPPESELIVSQMHTLAPTPSAPASPAPEATAPEAAAELAPAPSAPQAPAAPTPKPAVVAPPPGAPVPKAPASPAAQTPANVAPRPAAASPSPAPAKRAPAQPGELAPPASPPAAAPPSVEGRGAPEPASRGAVAPAALPPPAPSTLAGASVRDAAAAVRAEAAPPPAGPAIDGAGAAPGGAPPSVPSSPEPAPGAAAKAPR